MTQPLPAHPGRPPGPTDLQKDRTVDVVVAWILWCLLVGGVVLWAMILAFFGAIVGPLACPGGETNEQLRSSLCDGDGATVARVGFIGQWIVMALAVIGSLVGVVLATTRRRLAWIWPAAGIVLVIVAALVWWAAAAAVTS